MGVPGVVAAVGAGDSGVNFLSSDTVLGVGGRPYFGVGSTLETAAGNQHSE